MNKDEFGIVPESFLFCLQIIYWISNFFVLDISDVGNKGTVFSFKLSVSSTWS